MKKLYLIISAMCFTYLSFGQVYLAEDFSSGLMPPTGWTLDGQPAQWSNASTNKAGGTAPEAMFTYKQVTATSRLVSPVVDMTGVTTPVTLSFKHYYDWFANGPKIGVATRFGTGAWTTVWEQTPSTNVGPETKIISLTNIGQPNFQFCIYITGNLYNVDYWYIDDIKLFIPLTLDAKLASVDLPSYIQAGTDVILKGKVQNEGSSAITSFDVSYSINGEAPFVFPVTGVNIALGQSYDFVHTDPINLTTPGSYQILTTVENVNGGTDLDTSNNTLTKYVGVVPFLPPKKVIAEEATGTWCGWCVRGVCFMDYMAETYPDSWIGIAVHNGDPMTNTEYDNAIPSIIPNFPGYPSGTIDRSGDNYYDPSDFEAGYLSRITAISPASVDILNFELDTVSRVVSFIVQSEFIVDVNNELRFAAIISEDSLYGTSSGWNQANYYSGGGQGEMCGFETKPDPIPAAQMVYNHVARVILDTPYGTTGSIVGPVLAGSIHNYTYTYTIPAEWRFDKLHYTGVLIDMSSGEILNSNNVLGGHVGIAENIPETSVNVYPNPFSNTTNVVFNLKKAEKVQLSVCNSIGAVVYSENARLYGSGENKIRVNSDNLSNGFYFVKLTIGNKTITKKISVIK